MADLAFVIANAHYERQNDLVCCLEDARAIAAMLEALGRFDDIQVITDAKSDAIRSAIRDRLDSHNELGEVFYYFSGHGYQVQGEFFYCGVDFDVNRPNETGLSNSQLHDVIRPSSPNLVTKVIDACNSGNSLIKSDISDISDGKSVFKNVIQIASCQSSQSSITGNPLSVFTRHFCSAAVRKTEGSVYYTDIINTLRDDFLDDESHTPHFVSQGTGRERFTDRAERLAAFRVLLQEKWIEETPGSDLAVVGNTSDARLLTSLQQAEQCLVNQQEAEAFIGAFFDSLIGDFQKNDLSDYYDIEIVEHSDFEEGTTRGFIIRSLSRESRPDNLVTASISRRRRRNRNAFSSLGISALEAMSTFYGDDYVEDWDLDLNCSLDRVQMKVTFSPKFKALDEIRLVVTCAPSLAKCYIFELSTRHMRSDWNDFEESGNDIDRNWFELAWTDDPDWVSNGIVSRVRNATRKHIEGVSRRLEEPAKTDDSE